MKVKHTILIGFALLLAPLFLVQAQIPRTLSYQGLVTDAAGEIKPDGSYSFTFNLYDVSSGGTALWTESKTLSIKDGLFSTALGDQVIFPTALRFDKPYWLSIKVGSESELAPRIPLTSVGYSFHALRADTAEYALSVPTGGESGDITAVYAGSGLTGGGTSGDVTLAVASHLSIASLSATNTGTGLAGLFEIENPSNTDAALAAVTTGTGRAGSFSIENSSNSQVALYAKTYGTGHAGLFQIVNDTNSEAALRTSTTGTGYAGYFAGNVYTTGSYQSSDVRWKRKITTLEGALNKVLSLRGVQFEWNRDEYPDNGFREGKQIGLIAQEVEEVLPELVRADQDGYKAVDYQKITAILVEAIKEQQKEIEALKAAVAALQAQSDVALQE